MHGLALAIKDRGSCEGCSRWIKEKRKIKGILGEELQKKVGKRK